jgi:hypothetical protein
MFPRNRLNGTITADSNSEAPSEAELLTACDRLAPPTIRFPITREPFAARANAVLAMSVLARTAVGPNRCTPPTTKDIGLNIVIPNRRDVKGIKGVVVL